jgi:hypothetical protein
MKIWGALALTLLLVDHAVAHHAEAMFDHSRTLSVTGTVKEYLWANPHVLIYLEITDARGRSDVSVFEGGSAIVMKRNGWTRDSLSVGDKLAISYSPRRDGKPGGMLLTATLSDGKTLGWRPAATL